jgi:cbb3-type cytochrome c oxidase subunit III
MEARDIAILIIVVALIGFAVVYFVLGPGRRGPRPAGDIPLALRPYHSDEELEGPGMERAMLWGIALVLFMAFFLPVYWLMEPWRIEHKQEEFFREDVERGRGEFADACAQCHGSDARGGFAAHPDPDVDAPWPAPALHDIVARYEDNPNIDDEVRYLTQTVKAGRPGTPMPAWSSFYGGGMTDQQIESIVRYILSIQDPDEEATVEAAVHEDLDGEGVFTQNCARCHGEGAEGGLAPALTNVFSKYGADEDGDPDAEAAVRHIIENGIIVPDGADMPRWEGQLSDDAIDRVLDHLWEIQE